MASDFKIGEAFVDLGARNKDAAANDIAAVMRKAHEAQQQERRAAEDKRKADVAEGVRRKEMAKQQARQQIEAAKVERQAADERRSRLMTAVNLTNLAASGLPGAHGAASIAAAGVQFGAKGAGMMAAAQFAQYGIQGAGMFNPAVTERLQYQADRLQMAVGKRVAPVLSKLADFVEGGANAVDAPMKNAPQWSDFSSVRDRLQMAALRGGAGGGAGPAGGGIAARGGTTGIGAGVGGTLGVLGGPFMPLTIPLGAVLGDKLEEMSDDAYQGSWVQKKVRGIKKVFD